MSEEALLRYKVRIVMQAMEDFTVYAHSKEEASRLVLEGNGRHAGRHGPSVVNVSAEEMGGFDEPSDN